MKRRRGFAIVRNAAIVGVIMILLVCGWFGRLRWIRHVFQEDFEIDAGRCTSRLQELLKRASLPSFLVAGKVVVLDKADYDPFVFAAAIDEGGARRAVLSPREKNQRLEVMRFLTCTAGSFRSPDRPDAPCAIEEIRLVIDDVKVYPERDPILGKLYLERRKGEFSLEELSYPDKVRAGLGDVRSERLMRNVRSVIIRADTASVNARHTPVDVTVICQAPLPDSQATPVKALCHVDLPTRLRFHDPDGKR